MGIKSIWVKAPFKEEGQWRIEKIQSGTEIKKVEKGIFGKKIVEEEVPVYEEKKVWEVTETSDCEIDGRKFSENIESTIRNLEDEGYQIISITPVISGRYQYNYNAPVLNARDRPSYGWGYGFSYTEGVNIVAKSSAVNT